VRIAAGRDLHVSNALGILLIVPLGDMLDRRRLTPLMLVCSAVALLACAVAPTFGTLPAAITLLGLTTVAGQIVAPLAGDLADDASRGRVVGVVISGMLTGILVSRTVSGLVAGAAGWRVIYVVAAVAALVLAGLLYRSIRPCPRRPGSATRPCWPRSARSSGATARSAGRWCSGRSSSGCSPCSGPP
jgi:predicted MFS family arabinose efflux permease